LVRVNADTSRAAEIVRDAGRALGRVRELDVMKAMLDNSFDRAPASTVAVARARHRVQRQQIEARRLMVTTLEDLDLPHLNRLLSSPRRLGLWRHMGAIGSWRSTLRKHIATRAEAMAKAVRHATGVYMPKRSHRARVAVKKLRYAVEAAEETTLWTPPRLLKHLRRIQTTLGEIHDLQILIDRVDDLVTDPVARAELPSLIAALQDDLATRHHKYAARRERLFAIARACEQFAKREGRTRLSRPVIAASAAALPLLFLSRRKVA
jgi:CHAD domain-containing protein